MSIATKSGDSGLTGLVGGARVSKSSLRVEAYGTVDELNAAMGLARSICTHGEVCAHTERIQRTLFRVGAALSTPSASSHGSSALTQADVEDLTQLVYQMEATEGILADWSIPGAHKESAAYEVARTVCRRAERCAIRFAETGESVPSAVIPYLNRLSDLLWLFGRLIEVTDGIDARLRTDKQRGPNFSRAW